MRRPNAPTSLTTIVLLAAAALPATQASAATGGAGSGAPAVVSATCADGQVGACPAGALLRIKGDGLARARKVRFGTGRSARSGRDARPTKASRHRIVVAVPKNARSGKIKVVVGGRAIAGPYLKVLKVPAPAPAAETAPAVAPALGGAGATLPALDGASAFPVQGRYSFGTYVNGFGGGRGHQGQDVLADCGTPLVAAFAGTVYINKFQSRAGNYLVIDAADGTSQAYMHLRERSPLQRGAKVAAGDPIGVVGRTGAASACHLHFEQWTAPGWYQGGSPQNPLPLLRRLAGARDAAAR